MKKILLILSITVLAFTARGNSIVFNTLGPGDTYDQNLARDVEPGSEWAAQFTAGASGNLATVDLGLTYDTINPNGPVNVYLYGDTSGSPGTNLALLGSGTPTGVLGTTNNSLVSFAVAGTIPVTMGTTYWLVLAPADLTHHLVWWNNSSPAVSGSVAFSVDGTTWSSFGGLTLPAFRLTATSAAGVPDSGGTFLLLLGSVAALLALERMLPRQHASR
jgi:hypothetical protein